MCGLLIYCFGNVKLVPFKHLINKGTIFFIDNTCGLLIYCFGNLKLIPFKNL